MYEDNYENFDEENSHTHIVLTEICYIYHSSYISPNVERGDACNIHYLAVNKQRHA